MLTISQRLTEQRPSQARLTLPFELRQKTRLRTVLGTGEEVGIQLDRGQILRGGDLLLASDGRVVEVIAAPERVSVASTQDGLLLTRAAYHLGNRHVSLQIGNGWLRYLSDHVLDEMARGLGLQVSEATLPFEPEAGAYAGHSHSNVLLPLHSRA